jgi:hypothetical protein
VEGLACDGNHQRADAGPDRRWPLCRDSWRDECGGDRMDKNETVNVKQVAARIS